MDGEELADLDKLGPEKLLLRWMNYHLARAGYSKTVSNFGKDIADSAAYLNLLAQIQPADLSPPLSAFCVVSRKYMCLTLSGAGYLSINAQFHLRESSFFPNSSDILDCPQHTIIYNQN